MNDILMVIQTMVFAVHWLPVIVVTALSLVVAAIWHLPFLFGNTWKREVNPAGAERKINKPIVLGVSGILHFIAFTNVSLVVAGQGWRSGLLTALMISLVWIVTALGAIYFLAGRSLRLFAIDAGLYVVVFSLAGLVLGAW
ncbi:DUF1761 domain-containing protein [Geotalea toluenoxydans]|uniref:DUF1761 domain-containing protein n=1 Tax=Geotalea toluenoxydans TaxID=421624 RepID=UPI0006CF9A95|nr:DUF1761 domain-containing protein [Geotalea toluenoxydans]